MKEVMLNNFGWVGILVFIVMFSLIKYTDIGDTKWMDVIGFVVGMSIVIGQFAIFDALGKWILK